MRPQDFSFFSTKILLPRHTRGVIVRARLEPLLEELRSRVLTLVTAPLGCGKTTLGLAWAEALGAAGARVAWLSLDAEDDEPDRFMLYLASALNRVSPEVGKRNLELLGGATLMPIQPLVAMLVNELAERPEEIFLFLDDYQFISQQFIHDAVAQLALHAPENFHVVILGRSMPRLPFAPLRARNELLEIDATILRFDIDETQQLLRKVGNDTLATVEVRALHGLTEGWIGGLRAVLLGLRDQKDPARYLQHLSGLSRPLAVMFSDLLERVAPEMVAFMERICIVDRVCAPLAEALVGVGKGQAMLEQIERQQLFLTMLDQEGRWFAFHQLFRDVLRQRLEAHPASEVAALHRAASGWFASRNIWIEAVRHALAAGDSGGALRYVEQCAMQLVEVGDLFTLQSWERQLSEHLVSSPPRLRLALAWASLLVMAKEDTLRRISDIEADLESLPEAERVDIGWECKALRAAVIALTDDNETAGHLAEAYLREPITSVWAVNAFQSMLLSARTHSGRWAEAYAVPPFIRAPGEQARYLFSEVYRLCLTGVGEYRQLHFAEAERALDEALKIAADAPTSSRVMSALPASLLALTYFQQNRVDEALRLADEYRETIAFVGFMDCVSAAYRVSARGALVKGDGQRALALLEEAERIGVARGWPRLEAIVLLERTRIYLVAGRAAEASGCVQRLSALQATTARQPGNHKYDIAMHATLARAWAHLVNNSFAAAIAELEPCLQGELPERFPLESLRFGTALALAQLGAGNETAAVDLFLQVCQRAAGAEALRPIVDQPLASAQLIFLLQSRLTATGRDDHQLASFLDRLAATSRGARPTASPAPASAAEVLSPRERHVLDLVSSGQSNKEIARSLGISPETVKQHLKKVFAKLGVANRAQAAVRAQEVASG